MNTTDTYSAFCLRMPSTDELFDVCDVCDAFGAFGAKGAGRGVPIYEWE
ncbi:hypothetical protein ACFY12_24010 [Streptomyces sp. NPDC001339]